MCSNTDRVRLATALTALKFKPADQSIASYILDLRSQFPLSAWPSVSAAVPTDGDTAAVAVAHRTAVTNSWRTHALALERDYTVLQAKYEAEKIKNIALANSSTATLPMPVSSSDHASSGTAGGSAKKKTKKKKNEGGTVVLENERVEWPCQSVKLDLKSVLEGLSRMDALPLAPPNPNSLFGPLDAFIKITALANQSNIDRTLILSSSVRVIDAVGGVLDKALSSTITKQPSDGHCLETARTILYHVLSTIVPSSTPNRKAPSLTADDPFNIVLNKLMCRILKPLIEGFMPLSIAFITAAVNSMPCTANSGQGKQRQGTLPIKPTTNSYKNDKRNMPPDRITARVDIRPGVLSLFQTIICLLSNGAMPCLGLAPALALEAIRELENVLSMVPCRCRPEGDAQSHVGSRPMGSADVTRAEGDMIEERESSPGSRVDVVPSRETYVTADSDSDQLSPHTAGIRERVKRLARKDALWYLCTVLHVLCPSVDETKDQEEISTILQKGVLDALFRLVSRSTNGDSEDFGGGTRSIRWRMSEAPNEGMKAERRADVGVEGGFARHQGEDIGSDALKQGHVRSHKGYNKVGESGNGSADAIIGRRGGMGAGSVTPISTSMEQEDVDLVMISGTCEDLGAAMSHSSQPLPEDTIPSDFDVQRATAGGLKGKPQDDVNVPSRGMTGHFEGNLIRGRYLQNKWQGRVCDSCGRGGRLMDETGNAMVLAVVEKYWLTSLDGQTSPSGPIGEAS